jgi:hypothetical protein
LLSNWPLSLALHKKSWYFDTPQTLAFLLVWDYVGVIPRNILNLHFAPLHCLNKTFIPNFVHHHFWPKLLQEIKYLLWFILIKWFIPKGQMFWWFFFFTMGHLVNLSPKNYKVLPSPLVEITFLQCFHDVKTTLFVLHLHYFTWLCKIIQMHFFCTYIYIVLHNTK